MMKRTPLYAALMALTLPLHAATINVDNSQQLISKVSRANCGDKITLAPGQYTDINFTARQWCTDEQPLTIEALTPGSVTFLGNTDITLEGSFISLYGIHFQQGTRTKRADLITLNGQHNTVSNNKFSDVDLAEGVWIKLNGSEHQVLHNTFTGKRSGASYINIDVTVNQPSSHRVAYNYFSRPLLGANGGSASRVGHGSMHNFNARVIFEYNLFEQENGESEIISAKSSENIFRYNTFLNSEGHLSLRQGKRNLVYDNYFIGSNQPKQGGLFIRGEDHVIFNNYFDKLSAHPKKTDFGIVSFGSASAKANHKRANAGLNPLHFPLTKNILFANNSINNASSTAIVIGSQYNLKDKKQRTKLPESIYLLNNRIEKAPTTLQLIQPINGLTSLGNQYTNSENKHTSFDPLAATAATPLAPWLDKIGLDMSWQENIDLVTRMRANTAVGFTTPIDKQGNKVLPLTAQQTGANW